MRNCILINKQFIRNPELVDNILYVQVYTNTPTPTNPPTHPHPPTPTYIYDITITLNNQYYKIMM